MTIESKAVLKLLDAAPIARYVEGRSPVVKGIPLTPSQTARIDRFLARHPDFKYADSVRLIRERGCWYEQEGFSR